MDGWKLMVRQSGSKVDTAAPPRAGVSVEQKRDLLRGDRVHLEEQAKQGPVCRYVCPIRDVAFGDEVSPAEQFLVKRRPDLRLDGEIRQAKDGS